MIKKNTKLTPIDEIIMSVVNPKRLARIKLAQSMDIYRKMSRSKAFTDDDRQLMIDLIVSKFEGDHTMVWNDKTETYECDGKNFLDL